MKLISFSNLTCQSHHNCLGSLKAILLALFVPAVLFLPLFLQAQNPFKPTGLLSSSGSAPFVVTNTNDSGSGSLRQALLDANAHVGPDTIRFAIPTSDPGFAATSGVWMIKPQSGLPSLSDNGTVIDGFSQKDVAGDLNPNGPEILIDGRDLSGVESGCKITSADNVISSLVICGFKDCAIRIAGSNAENNWIWGNYLGTDASGADASANGNGLLIADFAKYNVIGGSEPLQRNVISGNDYNGCYIISDSNKVIGNLIGTDRSGTAILRNHDDGIVIASGAKGNRVGGKSIGERNAISGNGGGVRIEGEGTSFNVVTGNYIGTDLSGTLDLGNSIDGITISLGASNNVIGGLSLGEGNVISGNARTGIVIGASGTKANQVLGNLIGLDVDGNFAVATDTLPCIAGIAIWTGAHHNIIGPANIVSGNLSQGISIEGVAADSNAIIGNWVGLDITGQDTIPNRGHGIVVGNGAKNNLIGGLLAKDRNIVAGNAGSGLVAVADSTAYNLFQNNYSGTDTSGTRALGNRDDGAFIENSQHNIFQGNLLSGNANYGMTIKGSSHDNIVKNNKIGVQADGLKPLPNTYSGVLVRDYAKANIIGPENQIWYHPVVGIHLLDSTVTRIKITKNSIKGNKEGGIRIANGANNHIMAPVITSIAPLAGTAAPNSLIEVFTDSSDQACFYEDSTTADGSGQWTYTKQLKGPKVTVTARDQAGNTSEFSKSVIVSAVKEQFIEHPTEFFLKQNYPNPFNPSTTFEFSLPKSSFVTLTIFNLRGEQVAVLLAEQCDAGVHRITWDASGLASGVYLYRLQAGEFAQSIKLILMR